MKELISIQQELNAPKDLYNKFGNYHYRSTESILSAVKPLLKKYDCFLNITDEVVHIGGKNYVKATARIFNSEGNSVVSDSYAREEDSQKGMASAQITGSTSSYARKYALNGLFCIDDVKDDDHNNSHGKTLPSLQLESAEYKKAVTYVTNGGSIDEIKKKYSLSKEVEDALKNI